jgi:Domain of unknown function (DUF4082)/Bacterial Ig domain/Purple acid Phosphatase, N-terminal domain/Fibronectin type III domain
MRLRVNLISICGLVILGIPCISTAQTFSCSPPKTNQIVCENSQPGSPESNWMIAGSGDPTIQGFATSISVNQGETVHFKILTPASAYQLDIYRMGYYQGNGARHITTVQPSAHLPQSQPACLTDSTTGLIDCGNWAESASWTVPPDATSGVYFAEMTRLDTGGGSQIFFIVRADSSKSAILFQTSDTTWQAYNSWGGNNLYSGNTSAGRAFKVSYNRPFQTQDYNSGQSWVLNAEYPMIRWLEANGYDLTYATGVDTDRSGSLLLNHKLFLSVGHDEYWSAAQRANVQAARDAGVHLAFFSGNEVFWKTRWENSTDGSNTPYRTLVCYKETHANQTIDPKDPPTWTGTWRDPRFSPPADGGRPENALTGTIFYVNGTRSDAITVPAAFANLRFWRNTSVAKLTTGQLATFPTGTLGFEWDLDADNGFRPAGLIDLSSTTLNVNGYYLEDYGNTFGPGTATHSMTLYRSTSGAMVFAAGTVQWSWGLDSDHTNGSNPPDVNMQQATVNLLADMGLQAGTLQAGLLPGTASTDTTPPISTITSPASGASVAAGSTVTISGVASDGGGGVVGGVEVSVDGGTTWHRATGLSNWTYSWVPTALGSTTLKSRAVDDSLNIETPSAGVSITVTGTAPVISNVQATLVNSSGATITWTTDVPSSSQVNYGTSASYGSSTPVNNTLVTNHAVTLTGLTAGTLYHFQVTSQGSNGGLGVSGDFTFTTATTSGSGTITLWSASTTPSTASASDTSSVELGVKFTSDIAGYIVGVRFYKGSANTGTHSGSLWSSTGTLLASATFGGETASGWQEVDFGTPVAISANTVYVASYHAPSGGYSVDLGYFANSPRDSAPLHALRDGASGGNGLYLYGATSGFPTNTYQSSNYWVDVVFSQTVTSNPPVISNVQATQITQSTATITWSTNKPSSSQVYYGTTAAYGSSTTLDNTQVTSHSVILTGLLASTLYHFQVQSRDVANNVATSTDFTFTTATPRTTPPIITNVQAAAITTSGATITWTTDEPANSQVNYGTSSAYGSSTPTNNTMVTSHSVILSGLVASTLYHYQVASRDGAGNFAVSADFTFTTSAPAPQTLWSPSTIPSTPSQPDSSSVELGVKFTSDVAGSISAIRFYKGSANTGTHVGNLWDNAGTLLATATFTNESATGWQQAIFSTPVSISANTVYVASYHAPAGGYAVDRSYFATSGYDNPPLHALKDGASGGNGVFLYGATSLFPTNTYLSTNYWVDIVFTPASGSASLTSVTLNPTSVTGGSSSTGTVTLTGPAPSGGAVVTLSSSNTTAATVPASVTIAAGATSNTFTVTTTAVTTSTAVTITASYSGANQTATLTVTPAIGLSSVALNPTSVTGGSSSTGTVTLTGPAPSGGAVVTLSSSNTTAATVPASVTIAAGTTSNTFTVTTTVVTATTAVTISASYGGANKTATLTLTNKIVTFDDLTNVNAPLTGQYPTGLINWGSSGWFLSGPWGQFTTNSISFASPGVTTATFSFLASRQLLQLDAYNGGTANTTITLSCTGQPNKQAILLVGQVATIATGWTGTCSSVTISSTNGWDTNFDNLVLK